MPCLFAAFDICHRSHSPLCSLFLPNSKTNKNTSQNCSTYSFTITTKNGKVKPRFNMPFLQANDGERESMESKA